jgi:hypothetical protein
MIPDWVRDEINVLVLTALIVMFGVYGIVKHDPWAQGQCQGLLVGLGVAMKIKTSAQG